MSHHSSNRLDQTHSLESLFCPQFHEASFAKLVDEASEGRKTINKRLSMSGMKFSSEMDLKSNKMLRYYFTLIYLGYLNILPKRYDKCRLKNNRND